MEENGRMYLGDGVYAEKDAGMIELYTFDGISESDPIFIDSQVWHALKMFARARMEWEV